MVRHVCEPIRDMETVKEMIEVLRMRRNGFRDAMLFELGLSTALRFSDLFNRESGTFRME
ncbi:hypothetical protein NDK43_20855 [Neobacillus pocheonensis]|uniref:Integrase n=1 Tax=Neobacillus pocheonensis TaxID=363869 RepID=A0ABT0WDE1_9BACI|nr:hypothetical protein [Neobacillus pocheonensis]